MKTLIRLLPNFVVEKEYVKAGIRFGNAEFFYWGYGKSKGFDKKNEKLAKWEEEYISRGFRSVSVEDFKRFITENKPIKNLLRQRRKENEEPINYAKIYKKVIEEDCKEKQENYKKFNKEF